jgi:hypothetical protein
MDLKDLNNFIGKLTENVINKINEDVIDGWKYNNLTITKNDLESTALNWAENYWYNVSNNERPQGKMSAFEDDYGPTDVDFDESLLTTYLSLCEKYKNDPEIQEKYSDETSEVEPYTLERIGEIFGLDMKTMNQLMSISRDKFPSLSDQERINGLYRSLENIAGKDLEQSVYYYIQQNLKTESMKLTGDLIKETIIKPIVERYLKEAEMEFTDDDDYDRHVYRSSQERLRDRGEVYDKDAIENKNDPFWNRSYDDDIEESTTTTSVGGTGGFGYDAPAFGADKETSRRDFFSGGMRNEGNDRFHLSIKNLVENSLKKKGLISEANEKKLYYNKVLEALKDNTLFNDPSWISEYETLKNNSLNKNKSDHFLVNGQLWKTGMFQKLLQNNPQLMNNSRFVDVYENVRDDRGNIAGDKGRDNLKQMDREFELNKDNPEWLEKNKDKYIKQIQAYRGGYGGKKWHQDFELNKDNSEWLEKNKDKVKKFGNKLLRLGLGKLRKTSIPMVNQVINRLLNYIGNIYSERKYPIGKQIDPNSNTNKLIYVYSDEPLNLNKTYKVSQEGRIENAKPISSWKSINDDIIEKFESGQVSETDLTKILNIKDSNEFLDAVSILADDEINSEYINDNADYFISSMKGAIDREEYQKRGGMGDIEMQYRKI